MRKITQLVSFTWTTLDPFLFAVHHLDKFPASKESETVVPLGLRAEDMRGREIGSDFSYKNGFSLYHGTLGVPGFPSHPHLGFDTLTVVTQGIVDHFDSLGATARYGSGDMQWVTTGSGIQHSEMFPLLNEDAPNTMELFQIWLNEPAELKKKSPSFAMAWEQAQPVIRLDPTGKSSVRVLAGKVGDVQGPPAPPNSYGALPDAHVSVALIKLEPGVEYTLPRVDFDETDTAKNSRRPVNRALYLYNGSLEGVKGAGAERAATMIELDPAQEVKLRSNSTSGQPAELLLLQGRAIGEPVAQQGPFVMNTRQELAEAFAKFRKTQFGGWKFPHHEPVHPRSQGRFAMMPDGTQVRPSEECALLSL